MAQKILLIEDEELVADYLCIALDRAGYHVRLERAISDAQQAIQEEAWNICALITDGMGNNSIPGIALGELARSINPSLPVIVISGNPPPIDHHGDERWRFIQKPLTIRELIGSIEEMACGG